MESLISFAPVEFASGNDTAFLEVVNTPSIKRKTVGRCSVAGMGEIDSALTAKFLATIKGAVAALSQGDAAQRAQADLFDSFRQRFINSPEGLE